MSRKKLTAIIGVCIAVVIVVIVLMHFKPWERTYALSISVDPPQAGSVSPAGGEYESGERVTLTASPISGYVFDYWTGNVSDTTSTITITMDSDKSLTAHFVEQFTLSVSVSPLGAGSVSPSSGEYESGDQITLIASPASGYIFDYWTRNVSDTTSTITITMDSDKSLTAHFETTPPPPTQILLEVNHLKQLPDYCGEACYSMAADYLGKPLTQTEIHDAGGKDLARGLWSQELRFAGTSLGLLVEDYWEDLNQPIEKSDYIESCITRIIRAIREEKPVVVGWNTLENADRLFFTHFVLVVGFNETEKCFFIHDPGKYTGPDKVTFDEFEKCHSAADIDHYWNLYLQVIGLQPS